MLYRDAYERRLPHIQPLGGTFFVTYRLEGSLPVAVRQQLQEELREEQRRLRQTGGDTAMASDTVSRRYDNHLDTWQTGPMHLKQNIIGQLVADSLHFHDANRIELIAYCIMSNHVHTVFTLVSVKTSEGTVNSLESLMCSLKSYTGREANRLLGLTGAFWEPEWYDRCVRDDDELIRIVRYVLNNPVKAGLCQAWREWPLSYVKAEYDIFQSTKAPALE